MEDISLIEVIVIGLKSWGFLVLGMGILFVAIVILNKFTGKKGK